jgi:hypothetical protein
VVVVEQAGIASREKKTLDVEKAREALEKMATAWVIHGAGEHSAEGGLWPGEARRDRGVGGSAARWSRVFQPGREGSRT